MSVATVRDEIRAMGPSELARQAGCSDPDSLDSPGALLLSGVRDSVLALGPGDVPEAHGRWTSGTSTASPWLSEPYQGDPSDMAHEIAATVPAGDPAQVWAEFVDLGAWDELAGCADAIVSAIHADESYWVPMIALYAIAYRLASALLDRLAEAAP